MIDSKPHDGVPTFDRSAHQNVVEYAVQTMMKGKSPSSAAKSTAKKHSGFENVFFGPGISQIDPLKLEDALWDRLVRHVEQGMSKMKAGKEHYALDGTAAHFGQGPTVRRELKRRVIKALGHDPFPNDDRL